MRKQWMIAAVAGGLAVLAVLGGAVLGCSLGGSEEQGEHEESGRADSGEPGEGQGDEQESGEVGGEESAEQLTKQQTYDRQRAGAQLILTYDADTNSFSGTVRNTTDVTLNRVRVEVHLSNGVELGPTTPVDLAPGQAIYVTLASSAPPFETWSAHPEVGGGDSPGSENSGEHNGNEGQSPTEGEDDSRSEHTGNGHS